MFRVSAPTNWLKRKKMKYETNGMLFRIPLSSFIQLYSVVLLDSHFTSVVSASATNSVVHIEFAAIRANSQCWSYCSVMSSSFTSSSLRLSTSRMCHF